jgi:gliding motility-associated protein GldE
LTKRSTLEPDPYSEILFLILLPLASSSSILLGVGFLLFLIISSALVSGSEVAFFSLSPNDLHALEDDETVKNKRILHLREKPRRLLATILISNNFINIAIVLVSNYVLRNLIGEEDLIAIGEWLQSSLGLTNIMSAGFLSEAFNFIVSVAGVTFILVLFGEVIPKIYANLNNLRFARLMATPLHILNFLFTPLSTILVGWSTSFENRIIKQRSSQTGSSKEDLDKAIELTVGDSENAEEEADMLKGIVKFGDVSVKQIMKSRVDITAIDITFNFRDVMRIIKDSGFSRIPVFKEDFDNISGILYVKDLLGHTDEDQDFNWQSLIRESVLYVPESKKIDDLLKDFQLKRTHMAIVVDEYGGCDGLVTLEDVMEEVIGDIKDEFDEEEEVEYIQLDSNSYIFEGRTLLNDVCRIVGLNTDYFDPVRGDADSLAGLLIEILGKIPRQEREIKYNNITFKVISVTKRRIEKINIRIDK